MKLNTVSSTYCKAQRKTVKPISCVSIPLFYFQSLHKTPVWKHQNFENILKYRKMQNYSL